MHALSTESRFRVGQMARPILRRRLARFSRRRIRQAIGLDLSRDFPPAQSSQTTCPTSDECSERDCNCQFDLVPTTDLPSTEATTRTTSIEPHPMMKIATSSSDHHRVAGTNKPMTIRAPKKPTRTARTCGNGRWFIYRPAKLVHRGATWDEGSCRILVPGGDLR